MPAISRLLFNSYSVTPTSYTYAYFSDPLNVPKPLTTSGSSTTLTEVVSGDGPFSGAAIGDLIEVFVDGTCTTRTVTAVGSAPTSVTVDTAIDWSNGGAGRVFSRQRFFSGTTASDGWIWVDNLWEKLIQINLTAFNATSVDISIEGRIAVGPTLNATTIYSKSYTATGNDFIPINEDVSQIRLGIKVTASGGTNTLSAYFNGHLKRR